MLLFARSAPEGPPALCPLFSWYPLAYGRVPSPPSARCGMGRLCGERGTAQALRAPAGRKKRVSPHPAPKNLKPPRTTPKCHAIPRQPHPAANPAPSPSLPRIYPRIYIPLPRKVRMPRRARPLLPKQARPRASHIQPQPAANPAPSPSLPCIYPGIYAPLPDRFGCPAARVRSCRSRRVPPSRPPKGARGKRPPPPPEKLIRRRPFPPPLPRHNRLFHPAHALHGICLLYTSRCV